MTQFADLLTDDLRLNAWRGSPNPFAGHCYVASEAMYHIIGGKDAGWTPKFIRHEGSPHWYLQHRDGTILDPTAAQFDTPVPYACGRGVGFQTANPSRRAQTLINRLKDMS